jgi:hypothetical protein
MNVFNEKKLIGIGRNTVFQVAIYLVILILMTNLNAAVDAVLHPDISYFDHEHLIVGGITAVVTTIIYMVTIGYIRLLNSALTTIQTLEDILPVCSYCKRIRKPNADPALPDSWQLLEDYFGERTSSSFSHGICPTCMDDRFPYVQGHAAENQLQERNNHAPNSVSAVRQ